MHSVAGLRVVFLRAKPTLHAGGHASGFRGGRLAWRTSQTHFYPPRWNKEQDCSDNANLKVATDERKNVSETKELENYFFGKNWKIVSV